MGSSLPIAVCPVCGRQYSADTRFCNADGAALVATAAAAATRPRGISQRPILAGAIVAVLIAVVVYGLPLVFGSGFHTAEYVPSTTWFYATMTVRPGVFQLASLAQLSDTFSSQPGFDSALRAAQNPQSGNSTQPDFQNQILPLLDGEVSLAMYGPTQGTSSYVFFVHSKDPQSLAQLLISSNDALPMTQQYRDALMTGDGIGRAPNQLATATYKGWLLLSPQNQTLRETIDRLHGDTKDSLATNKRFAEVVNRLPSQKVGFAYADSSVFLDPTTMARATVGIPVPLRPFAERARGHAAMAITAESDGVTAHLEGMFDQNPKTLIYSGGGNLQHAFDLLPSDSLVAVADSDARNTLAGTDDAVTALLHLQYGPNIPADSLRFTHWLGGEVAAGLDRGTWVANPSFPGNFQGSNATYVVASVADANAGQREVSLLDPVTHPQVVTVNGTPLRQIQSGDEFPLYYGIFGDHLYFVKAPDASPFIAGTSTRGISTNPRYQMVKNTIGTYGVALFVDLQGWRQLLDEVYAPTDDLTFVGLKIRPFVLPLRALGANVEAGTDGAYHATVTIKVQK